MDHNVLKMYASDAHAAKQIVQYDNGKIKYF